LYVPIQFEFLFYLNDEGDHPPLCSDVDQAIKGYNMEFIKFIRIIYRIKCRLDKDCILLWMNESKYILLCESFLNSNTMLFRNLFVIICNCVNKKTVTLINIIQLQRV